MVEFLQEIHSDQCSVLKILFAYLNNIVHFTVIYNLLLLLQ